MAVIGIDLGTTNSLGCVYRNGKAELIPNAYGSYLTPSVVSMTEDGKLIVGQPAKDRLITHPERTVSSFKKDMGTGRSWKPGEKSFLPEELSSLVIRSIVEDAQNYLGEEIEEAVISVPAYFHDEQRVAVKRAGALAGIHVERIVNEPSAAALASYFTANEEQNMLVFDFGGGTLDVSLVDCFDTMVEIVSVAGNNRLGGDDFDRLIAEHFLREHGVARQQLRAQEYAVLLKQAERCKKLLSEHRRIIFNGNGYTEEWVQEAERRGLPNLKCMVDSIPSLVTEKAVKLFGDFGVYTRSELYARAEIEYETYTKSVLVEARTMSDMAGKQIIPAVIRYSGDLARSLNEVRTACPEADMSVQTELVLEVSSLLAAMKNAMEEIRKDLEKAGTMSNMKERAHFCYDEMVPAMNRLREPADRLEMIVDKEYWPFPSYGDMIFEV